MHDSRIVPTKGIQVKTIDQIRALRRIRCEDAILEIKQNGLRSLSNERLNHYIECAIATGLVAQVTGLAKIRDEPLTDSQVERLTSQCLQLEWVADALYAARHGRITANTRRELIKAMLAQKLVDNRAEALQLLQEKLE